MLEPEDVTKILTIYAVRWQEILDEKNAEIARLLASIKQRELIDDIQGNRR